jgi:hypothetical protein
MLEYYSEHIFDILWFDKQFHMRCHYLGKKRSTKFRPKNSEFSGSMAWRPVNQ